ncbi:hypothetical protein HNO88_002032 [Novosphingobium chloroacetimidivorans]|uniref:Uncharacterized protein n=1 Tax=Novosphingobium chloroacetimidivorans TaxID=1428314 RepID=A0A7W7KA24_9SPHN|nr:hypothetical protein [Novosphingobium chloroacetimidivorans]MBB4858706.1 hypothetical protein [Novosphingobium chloroacetimidivorans]
MAQDKPSDGAPQEPTAAPDDLPEHVSDDLGGVQGEGPDERSEDSIVARPPVGEPTSEPVPDAGEIEWAGQVVKKPPTPST